MKVFVHRDLNDEPVRIVRAVTEFVLSDENGHRIATGPNPRHLSNYAFRVGALSVRHDYAEDFNGRVSVPTQDVKPDPGGNG